MCIYIYVLTYTHIYINIHIHTNVHKYTYAFTLTTGLTQIKQGLRERDGGRHGRPVTSASII